MRTSATLAALLLSALSLLADETDNLIDAAKKAAAQKGVAAAESNYAKAIDALDPADARFNSTTLEFASFLRGNQMPDRAEAALRKATERQTGVQPAQRVSVLLALAEAEMQLRNAVALENTYGELVKAWIGAVGPDQPVVANSLIRLAQTQEGTGKFKEAVTSIQRALPILKKAFGPSDASVGFAESILSRAQIRSGDKDGAAESARDAKQILSKVFDATAVAAMA